MALDTDSLRTEFAAREFSLCVRITISDSFEMATKNTHTNTKPMKALTIPLPCSDRFRRPIISNSPTGLFER